jgi:hypothetical protein
MANEIFSQLNINNLNSRIDLKDMKLLRAAFGSDSVRFFVNNLKGRETKFGLDFSSRLDSLFFENFSHEIGDNFTPEAYLSALKKANETHQYVIDRLGLPQLDAGLINNVVAFSERPFDRLALLSSANISPLLRYQLAEQLMLGLIHIHLDNRTRNNKLRSQLDEFVTFTDNYLFEGQKVGETKVINVYSTHDNENRTKKISFSPLLQVSNNQHQKMTQLRTREIHIGGKKYLVAFDIRKKDDKVAALKSLERAVHKSDGNIEIKEDVEDMVGTKFVIIGGVARDFITCFENIVREYYGDIKIEEDNYTNEDNRRQSKRHTFKRRQLYLRGNKFEVIFSTLREFLNDEYDIGEKGEDGFYSGAAHSLFEIARISHGASHIIPQDLYGLDVFEYGRQTQQREVERLLLENNMT